MGEVTIRSFYEVQYTESKSSQNNIPTPNPPFDFLSVDYDTLEIIFCQEIDRTFDSISNIASLVNWLDFEGKPLGKFFVFKTGTA